MTVITISTVGYGEVSPLTDAGRLFTMVLIITGVGLVLYLLTSVVEILIERRIQGVIERRAMQREINKLKGHVIVCGLGRFGGVVVEELTSNHVPVVIIESDAAKESELRRTNAPYLIGSALSDEVLERAGVRRASAIVVATSSEAPIMSSSRSRRAS